MTLSSFRELVVWQKSYVVAKDVYLLCKKLPKNEQYGIISQLQRCAVSIPSNIAEGQQRNNRAEYRQFLGIARGSAAELENTTTTYCRYIRNRYHRVSQQKYRSSKDATNYYC